MRVIQGLKFEKRLLYQKASRRPFSVPKVSEVEIVLEYSHCKELRAPQDKQKSKNVSYDSTCPL